MATVIVDSIAVHFAASGAPALVVAGEDGILTLLPR